MFVENLKRLRRQHFWSQAQLAQHAEMSKTTIVRLENGQNRPLRQTVITLATVFGIDPRDLANPEETAEAQR